MKCATGTSIKWVEHLLSFYQIIYHKLCCIEACNYSPGKNDEVTPFVHVTRLLAFVHFTTNYVNTIYSYAYVS